jgi:hypothetical protein
MGWWVSLYNHHLRDFSYRLPCSSWQESLPELRPFELRRRYEPVDDGRKERMMEEERKKEAR